MEIKDLTVSDILAMTHDVKMTIINMELENNNGHVSVNIPMNGGGTAYIEYTYDGITGYYPDEDEPIFTEWDDLFEETLNEVINDFVNLESAAV